MRNVAGEICGSMAAMKKAVELGLKELVIYYDYMGIEMWAKGLWKRNKKGTMAYYDYAAEVQKELKLTFVKVKGHSRWEMRKRTVLPKKALELYKKVKECLVFD